VTERFDGVAPDAGGFATLTLGEVPAPRSINIRWTTVRNCTTSAGSTEAVTNSTTTSGVGPDGKVVYSGGSSSYNVTFYSPTSASTSGFPPGATVEITVESPIEQTLDWQIVDVSTTPWKTAALPADLITGVASGSVTTAYPPGIVAGKAFGKISVTLAAATQMHEGMVEFKNSSTTRVAFGLLRVEPSSAVRAQVTPPPPADVARTPTGVAAGPKSFHGRLLQLDRWHVVWPQGGCEGYPAVRPPLRLQLQPTQGKKFWGECEMTPAKKRIRPA